LHLNLFAGSKTAKPLFESKNSKAQRAAAAAAKKSGDDDTTMEDVDAEDRDDENDDDEESSEDSSDSIDNSGSDGSMDIDDSADKMKKTKSKSSSTSTTAEKEDAQDINAQIAHAYNAVAQRSVEMFVKNLGGRSTAEVKAYMKKEQSKEMFSKAIQVSSIVPPNHTFF
jgi:hypothetical protein